MLINYITNEDHLMFFARLIKFHDQNINDLNLKEFNCEKIIKRLIKNNKNKKSIYDLNF